MCRPLCSSWRCWCFTRRSNDIAPTLASVGAMSLLLLVKHQQRQLLQRGRHISHLTSSAVIRRFSPNGQGLIQAALPCCPIHQGHPVVNLFTRHRQPPSQCWWRSDTGPCRFATSTGMVVVGAE